MTILVLLVLAVIWAVVIGAWLKERAGSRVGGGADSVLSFRRQLSTLRRTGPGGAAGISSGSVTYGSQGVYSGRPSTRTAVPTSPGAAVARKRRRDILFTLLALVGLTFVLAVSLQSLAAIYAFFLCDVLLGAYIVLLRRAQRLNEERRTKVLHLDTRQPHHGGEVVPLPLRRSAAN